jgi:hypothetical protein
MKGKTHDKPTVADTRQPGRGQSNPGNVAGAAGIPGRVKEYASEQTKATGKKISMSVVVTTLSRMASPELNDLIGKCETEKPSSPKKP